MRSLLQVLTYLFVAGIMTSCSNSSDEIQLLNGNSGTIVKTTDFSSLMLFLPAVNEGNREENPSFSKIERLFKRLLQVEKLDTSLYVVDLLNWEEMEPNVDVDTKNRLTLEMSIAEMMLTDPSMEESKRDELVEFIPALVNYKIDLRIGKAKKKFEAIHHTKFDEFEKYSGLNGLFEFFKLIGSAPGPEEDVFSAIMGNLIREPVDFTVSNNKLFIKSIPSVNVPAADADAAELELMMNIITGNNPYELVIKAPKKIKSIEGNGEMLERIDKRTVKLTIPHADLFDPEFSIEATITFK